MKGNWLQVRSLVAPHILIKYTQTNVGPPATGPGSSGLTRIKEHKNRRRQRSTQWKSGAGAASNRRNTDLRRTVSGCLRVIRLWIENFQWSNYSSHPLMLLSSSWILSSDASTFLDLF
eukprot:g39209.t1